MSYDNEEWFAWHREWLRYKVARCVYSDFLGGGYKFARKDGRIVRFWTRKAANAYAESLNAQEKPR